MRWTQRPHAGYRWFTGSDPDNANATWAFIDSLSSITRRGMSFNVHKVASHPLDVKHDTYIFSLLDIFLCFISSLYNNLLALPLELVMAPLASRKAHKNVHPF